MLVAIQEVPPGPAQQLVEHLTAIGGLDRLQRRIQDGLDLLLEPRLIIIALALPRRLSDQARPVEGEGARGLEQGLRLIDQRTRHPGQIPKSTAAPDRENAERQRPPVGWL